VRLVARVAVVTAVLGLAVAGCSAPQSSSPDSTGDSGGETLTVFAAASLKKSFTEIAEQFKADNPGSDVEFNFAGSSDLVTQLMQGAPGDVFASADTKNMDKAAQADLLATDPVNFASNTLTIVTAQGNPKKVASFNDLSQPDLSVVVCAPQVPCGSVVEKVEKATGVQLDPVSEESQVTDVLNKVTSGEADAGLVYATDALGAGAKVTSVPFPESAEAVNTYPIAVLKQAGDRDLAGKFLDLVTGEAGQKVLAASGFAKP